MGALMRSSFEFQGGDLSQVIDRHRSLIAAVATRDRITIAAALKDHYLNPKTFADTELFGDTKPFADTEPQGKEQVQAS
jgi:DNA-binding GntR family transcriptional regulator